jgi:hypothetical protein
MVNSTLINDHAAVQTTAGREASTHAVATRQVELLRWPSPRSILHGSVLRISASAHEMTAMTTDLEEETQR